MEKFSVPEFLQNQTVDEIHKKMLDSIPADIDKSQGGFAWDFTRPTALAKSEFVELSLTEAIKLIFPQFSYGEWLELHGKNRGIIRKAAASATGSVTISGKEGVYIPIGTIVSTESVNGKPSIDFLTTEDAFIPTLGHVDVKITAAESGPTGNVSAGMLKFLSSNISNIDGIENLQPIHGGTEEESDESLRKRIVEFDLAQGISFVGSVSDYKRWAESVPGVGTAIVVPAGTDDGLVTIILTDANGEPATGALCGDVYDYIMGSSNVDLERRAPINANLSVVPPTTIPIQITAVVQTVNDMPIDGITLSFLDALRQYLPEAAEEKSVKYTRIGRILSNTLNLYDYKDLKVNGSINNIPLAVGELPTVEREAISFIAGEV